LIKLRTLLLSNLTYILILILSLSYSLIITKIIVIKSNYEQEDICLNGVIEEYNFDGDKLSLGIFDKEKIIANYYFKTLEEKEKYLDIVEYGSLIKVCGNLNSPLNNTIPHTFNYKRYLYNNGIHYILDVTQIEEVINKINYYDIKNIVQKRLNKNNTFGYLNAFVLGDMKHIDYDMYQNYQNNGITHLFAISGSHISLISLIFLTIFKKLKIGEIKRYLITTLILLLFAFLTGFPASVKRSILFFIILSINKIYTLEIKNINALILTGCILILYNPFIIYDIGFLFSIATTFGIIHQTDSISKGNYFQVLFKTSAIAFLYSAPISWMQFYEINIFSIINNLIFVPLITFIIYPLSIISIFIPIISQLFLKLINILEIINTFTAKIDFMQIIIMKPSIIAIFIYYTFLIILKYQKKAMLGLIIIILIYKIIPFLDSKAYIYYLDVGQGDSALVIEPFRKHITMIDTGGKITYEKKEWQKRRREYKISDNITVFLKSLGITTIDTIILSHGDFDHIGEYHNLSKSFKINNVWLNNGEYNKEELSIIKSNRNNFQKEIHRIYQNLNPGLSNNENDNSQITYFEIYNKQFLFLGDISKTIEEKYLNTMKDIDFLKIAHHGSKTSSSEQILKKLNPSYAIISSGRNNRYNHPSIESIETLNKLNINFYNTKEMGTIKLTLKPKSVTIRVFQP